MKFLYSNPYREEIEYKIIEKFKLDIPTKYDYTCIIEINNLNDLLKIAKEVSEKGHYELTVEVHNNDYPFLCIIDPHDF
jgi:hypothetical protein